jgi:hypothetical protein
VARSIHTTRRSLAQLAQKEFASPEQKNGVIEAARRELRRKRRIKRRVKTERRTSIPPFASFDPATIPIEVHHASRYIHHSASVVDLRALLRLLPPTATEGISSIKLILAKECIEESCAFKCADDERDPFTGRFSYQVFPGVYAGAYLGAYTPGRGQIALHAHVYDPAKLPLPRNVCALHLRLEALKTFVHEVAHHHDEICRVARGRWLADRKENVEWYAEKMEHEWTLKIVLPYLKRAYPADVKALLDFVEQRGGLRLPLEFFAGDPRKTLRNGLTRLALTTSSAFESWVESLSKCADLAASQLAFAWELHYVDKYTECLQILDSLLSQNPHSREAFICKGDTLVHLERYDEALSIAEALLNDNPADAAAWKIRGDVFEARCDWAALLKNSYFWLDDVPDDSKSPSSAILHRAIAYCGLGDMENMEEWIEALANFGNRKRNPEFIRKTVFRRAGKPLPKLVSHER